jgi:hypothetical protein
VYSMNAMNNMGGNRVSNRTTPGLEVVTTRLGDIDVVRQHCHNDLPIVLKMDIEGFEFAAFRGAEYLWQSGCVRAFFVELLPAYHPLTEILGLQMLLKSYGYEPLSTYNDQHWLLMPHERSAAHRRYFFEVARALLCREPGWRRGSAHCIERVPPIDNDALLAMANSYRRSGQRYGGVRPDDPLDSPDEFLLEACRWIIYADQTGFTHKPASPKKKATTTTTTTAK